MSALESVCSTPEGQQFLTQDNLRVPVAQSFGTKGQSKHGHCPVLFRATWPGKRPPSLDSDLQV